MALPTNINTLEKSKFRETDSGVAVAIVGEIAEPNDSQFPDDQSLSMNTNGGSTPWDISAFERADYEVSWTGATGFTSTIEIQGSVTGINWNVIDEDETKFTLDSGSGVQSISVKAKEVPNYIRLYYTKNTETTGTISITTGGILR